MAYRFFENKLFWKQRRITDFIPNIELLVLRGITILYFYRRCKHSSYTISLYIYRSVMECRVKNSFRSKPINPFQLKIIVFFHFLENASKSSVFDNIVRHYLAGSRPPGHAGRRWHQPDFNHLLRPLPIMVMAFRWRAMTILPTVDHFVYQGLQNLNQTRVGYIGRVYRDLMAFISMQITPTLRSEIPHHAVLPLDSEDYCGKAAFK